MNTLIINDEQVRRLLPMNECIEAMEQALITLANADAVQPLRSAMWQPDCAGLLGVMPGFLGEPRALGIKVVTIFPGNHGTKLDAHQGVVLLFDTTDGRLLAIMDATEITAIRTAAVSAVATRALARPDAADLAILGSGTQARSHLEAMLLVRPIKRIRVWSRNHDRARRFADDASTRLQRDIEPMRGGFQAVRSADIICTTTAATEPVLDGDWIAAGAHINAVGACLRRTRELDTQAVLQARLFVDRRESALNEAGDFLIPRSRDELNDSHILGELGEVLTNRTPGRTSPDDRTLFKSLGLAVEDLAAAHHIYKKASEDDTLPAMAIGGSRRDDS
jgi:ornithine cyclodeaminase